MTSTLVPFVSDWERATYYHGVSVNPPQLLYRSNWRETPFPRPVGEFQSMAVKTAHGVFDTPLNPVWRTVGPQIRDTLNAQKLRYAAIQPARFSTKDEDGHSSLGPVVIWIAMHPGTTTADDAHEASPRILAVLKANGVHGAVVEWFEGAIEKLSRPSPPLLCVAANPNPTYHVRRFLTAVLGMPIATERHDASDHEGSVAFFFHEGKDARGHPSRKVFGVSNAHVLLEDVGVSYLYQGAGGRPRDVRVAGYGRFQRGLDEIKDTIDGFKADADRIARDIVEWTTDLQSEDLEEAEEAKQNLDTAQTSLAKMLADITVLENFEKEVNGSWTDRASRRIGHVEWAPAKSINGYTLDIGTFELDADKFSAHFKGNVVDFGAKFTPFQVEARLKPFRFPRNRRLRIQGCRTAETLAHPDTVDSNGKPCIVVMKDGSASDLTFGRYAGLEAYTSDYFGVESVELAFYNYDSSENFAAKGDSGSLIFDSQGRMVGVLHAGLVKDGVHITYATPAWWFVEQLRNKYPHADFDRKSF